MNVQPKVELLKVWDNSDITNQEMLVQQIGRTCYAKCDLLQTMEGASRFVDKYVIQGKHTSLLEHVWLTMAMRKEKLYEFLIRCSNKIRQHINIYEANMYYYHISANYITWSRINRDSPTGRYTSLKNCLNNLITVNNHLRGIEYDFSLPSPSSPLVQECYAYTFKVTGCSRGFTHELVRHRPNIVFSQQSTRFVNEKNFNFIEPLLTEVQKNIQFLAEIEYLYSETISELPIIYQDIYNTLIRKGLRPGEARQYLPIGIESPIVFTCNYEELLYLFSRRYYGEAGKPAWEMKRIMTMVKEIYDAI